MFKQEQMGVAAEIRKRMRKSSGAAMGESLKMDGRDTNQHCGIFLYSPAKDLSKYLYYFTISNNPKPCLSHA